MKGILTTLLIVTLCGVALATGGTRLCYALPAYLLLAVTGLGSWFCLGNPSVSTPTAARPNVACLIGAGLFFAYVIGRGLSSPQPYLALPEVLLAGGCAVVYLLAVYVVIEPERRARVLGAACVVAAAGGLIGVHQFTMADNWMPFGFLRPEQGSRASGFWAHPITFAGYCEMVGAVALAAATWANMGRAWRVLAGFAAVVCYGGVAISGSRGGYASVVVSLVFFVGVSLWMLRRSRPENFARSAKWLVGLVVGGLITAVALMQQHGVIKERLDGLAAAASLEQKDVRLLNWAAALDQWRTAPTLGTGAGTHLYYGRIFRREGVQVDPIHAHNDYLELAAEYGAVGLGLLGLFLVVHLCWSWQALLRGERERLQELHRTVPLLDNSVALQLGALTATVAVLAHSAVDFNLHTPSHALVMAFLLGVMASPEPNLNPQIEFELPEVHPTTRLARWGVPLLALALGARAGEVFPSEWLGEKARVALREKQLEKAVEYGRAALDWRAESPWVWAQLGDAYRYAGLERVYQAERRPYFAAAEEYYQAALEILPQEAAFWVRLGEVRDELRKLPEADTAYRRALALDPKLGVLYGYYAKHLYRKQRIEEADEMVSRWIALARPTSAQIYLFGIEYKPENPELLKPSDWQP